MNCFVVMLFIAFLIYINMIIKKSTLNVAQGQNIIWFIAYALYSINYFDYYKISNWVCVLSIVYLVAFNFAYLCGKSRLAFNENNLSLLKQSTISKRKERKIIYSSILSWIIAIPLLKKSIPILSQYGMLKMRWILYGETTFFSGLDMCIISYILRPIAIVAIIYMAEQIAIKNIKKKIVGVVLLDVFLLVFLTAGRALLQQLVIYVVLVIIVIYRANIKRILHEYKKYLFPAILILGIVLAVSAQRISRNNGIIKEAMIYLFSSMPYLTALINVGYAAPQYSIAGYTLSFVIQPIELILQILGVNINLKYDLSSVTSNLMQIGANANMNAVGSTLLPFYLDIGIIGVIIYGIILALFMKYIEKQLSKKYDTLSFAKYLFLVNGIFLSIQNYSFGGTATFATWVLICILLR